MKRWLLLTFIFGLIGLPGTLFLVNTLEVSNQVHVTALVEESGGTEIAEVSSSSGSGGGLNGQAAEFSDNQESDEVDNLNANSDENESDSKDEEDGSIVDEPDELEESDEEAEEEVIAPEPQAALYFGGYAFPNAQIIFTLDGEATYTFSADSEGYFEGSFGALTMGEHIFSFQAASYEDKESRLISYAYTVVNESPLYITSILLPPIFGSVENGQGLGGVAIPGSEIQVYGVSQSDQKLVELETIQVNEDGTYKYEVDLKDGAYSQYYVACSFQGQECGYSGIIPVQVVGGFYEIPSNVFADFTNDIQVNFVDFSFMRAAFLSDKDILFYDLDEDGELTVKDFSLLDYQWTQ